MKLLNEYPVTHMNTTLCDIFMVVCFYSTQAAEEEWKGLLSRSPVAKILHGRVPPAYRDRIDSRVFYLVALMINNPGRCVLWAYTLYRLAQKYGGTLSWDNFVYEFPNGYPIAASYDTAWDEQKYEFGNLLDEKGTWE